MMPTHKAATHLGHFHFITYVECKFLKKAGIQR